MRSLVLLGLILLLAGTFPPQLRHSISIPGALEDASYIVVGGQNGTWFQQGQAPRLYKISLHNGTATSLVPVSGQGTVWSGGWNGSQMLVSGWGRDPGPSGSNPYLYLYNGQEQIVGGSLNQYSAESSWHGGDIFATSYNGKEWLLSGMGSGVLKSYSNNASNHMGLALFDGYNFTDLSYLVPEQQDGILYANAWNGKEWLVGGGFEMTGVLFAFNGTSMVDLTPQISRSITNFGSVQSIAWNGEYWMIGGVGYVAKYDGQNFVDLTQQLGKSMHQSLMSFDVTVNSIAWNGSAWMIGGGAPVAETFGGAAWLAMSDNATGFVDLSSSFPSYISNPGSSGSSILSICHSGDTWVIGGYSGGQAVLLLIDGVTNTDISSLVSSTMSYVSWVNAGFVRRETIFVSYGPSSSEPIVLTSTLQNISRFTANKFLKLTQITE